MEKISFGNLQDWGQVLELLEQLAETGRLGACQDELIRLLRFDRNWRLREAAIESLACIDRPGFELAKAVFSIVSRKDLYYDVRILAVDGLSKLTAGIVRNADLDKDEVSRFVNDIITGLEKYLQAPEPPKFHDALHASLNQLRQVGKAA